MTELREAQLEEGNQLLAEHENQKAVSDMLYLKRRRHYERMYAMDMLDKNVIHPHEITDKNGQIDRLVCWVTRMYSGTVRGVSKQSSAAVDT